MSINKSLHKRHIHDDMLERDPYDSFDDWDHDDSYDSFDDHVLIDFTADSVNTDPGDLFWCDLVVINDTPDVAVAVVICADARSVISREHGAEIVSMRDVHDRDSAWKHDKGLVAATRLDLRCHSGG